MPSACVLIVSFRARLRICSNALWVVRHGRTITFQLDEVGFSASVASALKVPRQQLLDVFLLMAFDDGCDDTGQVAMRLDFVQLTGLNE